MRGRSFFFTTTLTFALAVSATARDIEPTAGAFLDIDVNARGIAMGGTGFASAQGLQSAYSNPAGLSHLSMQRAGLLHAQWFEGLTLEWAGYGVQVGERSGAAVAATFLRSGSVDRYDEIGNPEGSFHVYDAALGASFGHAVTDAFRCGLTAKVLHQSVDDVSATGFAADLGATYDASFGTVAAVATNLGADISIDGETFPLPTSLALGVSMPLFEERLRVNVGGNYPVHYYEDVRLGVEVHPVDALALRAGYRYVLEPGTDDQLTALTWGVGVWASSVRFDYAFQPFDQLGDTHRIGLTAFFGGSQPSTDRARGTGRPADAAAAPPARRADDERVPEREPERAAAPAIQAPAPAESAPSAESAPPAEAPAVDAAPQVAERSEAPTAPAAEAPQAERSRTTRWAVVAGTHRSRISALQELRSLRMNGLDGGTLQKLDDGRYRIVVGEFKSKKSAEQWIDGPGVKHGKLSFGIVALD